MPASNIRKADLKVRLYDQLSDNEDASAREIVIAGREWDLFR
jgi:hypothetical protein